MGVIAMPRLAGYAVVLALTPIGCSAPAEHEAEPRPSPDIGEEDLAVSDDDLAETASSPVETTTDEPARHDLRDHHDPVGPAPADELLRDAIRQARKAHREGAYNYHTTVLAASDAYAADENRRTAYAASLEAYEASKAVYDAEDATEATKRELATLREDAESVRLRFIRHERDWERRETDLAALEKRQRGLVEEISTKLSEAVNARTVAYRTAAEAWTSLLPTAIHEHAAAVAEEAAGMNPGAFGGIGEVHSYFMRCTSRINPLTGIGEQKRCYDYGVAMLTYLNLNPISDIEDKYENMTRSVVNRMETIGWKLGDHLQFQSVR